VQTLVGEAHERYGSNADGENAQVYPALAAAPSDLYGVCVCGTGGATFAAGDADAEFSIMSVSKPFVFALVCQSIGADQARARLGSTGLGCPSTRSRRFSAAATDAPTQWSTQAR
jgi:glutaminase